MTMRKWVMAGAGVAAVGVCAALLAPGWLRARPLAKQNDGPPAAQLGVGQVVLYSSGVGYFQREGSVDGDARVDLSFPVSDVNDLIKSMVLRDLDGGSISAVSIDSSAPTERTLRSFAINLTGNPTYADVLHQARGEKVEVALSNAGPGAAGTLTGTIVGVETQKQAAGKEAVEATVLNLWCSDGMRAVKLSDVQRCRFLNPVLEGELKKALETLALSHDTQKKAVSIRFVGEGKRRVKVGYVVESPVWKTSYRLVLGTKKGEEPYLQGWAVVENPSDEDWRDVRMALVSGRPISFQMDLYQSLYVNRPVVVPELFASLRPVAYSGSMEDGERMMSGARNRARGWELAARNGPAKKAEAKDAAPAAPPMAGLAGGGEGRGGFGRHFRQDLADRMDLGKSVASAASAGKVGDSFQYVIDKPVSLPRQKSALLPIVTKEVQAERVSIYNERTQAKFPLLGLRFKNTSGLSLMQGPITVFEGSTYAGDARVLDLQPGEERLLSYAIDLGVEVNAVPSYENGRILSVKAVKGLIHTTVKNRQVKTYQVKNRSDSQRTLLIEHPVNNAFRLVGDKPKETASDVYRFEVKAPAGTTKSQVVSEEHEVVQSYSLSNSGEEQVKWFLQQPTASKKVQEGIQRAWEMRLALGRTRQDLGEARAQLKVLVEDQQRIRANIKELPSTSKAYKRLVEKIDEQEPVIEKHQADVKRLLAQQAAQQKALDDFLASFSAE
jgi:hypothetical protein